MDRNAKVKRVVAAIVIVLAVLGLIVAVVGICGSWIIKARVQEDILQRLDRLKMVVNRADMIVDRVDDVVGRATDRIQGIETAAIAFGGVLEENRVVVNLISNLLGADLSSRLQGAQQRIVSVQSTAEAIDGLIETLDSLPFLDLKERMPRLSIFGDIASGLDQMQTEVDATRTEVDEKEGDIVEGGVSIITDRTGRLLETLGNIQNLIDEVSSRIETLQNRIQDAPQILPGRLFRLTLPINLILLLIGVALLSLLTHALTLYRRPELGWRELLLPEEKPAPAKSASKSTTTSSVLHAP